MLTGPTLLTLAQTPPEKRETFDDEGEAILRELGRNIHLRGPPSWGPVYWTPLHMWTLLKVPARPTEEQRRELTRIVQEMVPELIPCGNCSGHWRTNAADVYPHTETAIGLFKWFVDKHNWVNVNLKGLPPLSYTDAVKSFANATNVSNAIVRATRENRGLEPKGIATGIGASLQTTAPWVTTLATVLVLAAACVALYYWWAYRSMAQTLRDGLQQRRYTPAARSATRASAKGRRT